MNKFLIMSSVGFVVGVATYLRVCIHEEQLKREKLEEEVKILNDINCVLFKLQNIQNEHVEKEIKNIQSTNKAK